MHIIFYIKKQTAFLVSEHTNTHTYKSWKIEILIPITLNHTITSNVTVSRIHVHVYP